MRVARGFFVWRKQNLYKRQMKILINNRETETAATTLLSLATELQLPEKGVAVAVGNKMVPRTDWADTQLKENDSITIIKATCGG